MITKDQAIAIRDTVDAGLVAVTVSATLGQMSLEAAVCNALGVDPAKEDPGIVSPALLALVKSLNALAWASPAARAAGLRRLALAQVDSLGFDDDRFRNRVLETTIRKAVPVALRKVAQDVPAKAAELEAAALKCEQDGTKESYEDAIVAQKAAKPDAAPTPYQAAAAAYDAVATPVDNYLAASNAYVAAFATTSAVSSGALAAYAEWVVGVLIEMNAPGCQWLDLVPA